MSVSVEPVEILFDRGQLADLRERLARTRWAGSGVDGWAAGVPDAWLRDLVAAWESFDVAAFGARLDALEHLRVDVDGQVVHVMRRRGEGPNPTPLVLTHGWPGSFCEYLPLIERLADPVAHGGDAADAFDVVVPSLPGFGFSAPPLMPGGLPAEHVAELWHRIMGEGLGHRRYAAHGSDLGAGVTAWLARRHPEAVIGIHLATPGLALPPQPWTSDEAEHACELERWTAQEGGYAHQQATKPATLAAGLQDSPAGLAAWIGEKVVAWSSTDERGEPMFDRDLLLGTLTLYWTTGTIMTSLLPYWVYRHRDDSALPAGEQPPVPTAVTIFGGERVPFPKPPRELAERYFTVTAWAEHDRGGHFPAVAEPQLLAQTLREVFRPLRAASPTG